LVLIDRRQRIRKTKVTIYVREHGTQRAPYALAASRTLGRNSPRFYKLNQVGK